MNTIPELKAQLKSMYPGYRFEIKSRPQTSDYCILVFKEHKTLSTLEIATNTPMNQFWEVVKGWMNSVLKQR